MILDQSLVIFIFYYTLFSHYLQLYIIKYLFYYTVFFGYILTLFLYELFHKDPSIPCSPLKVADPSLKTSARRYGVIKPESHLKTNAKHKDTYDLTGGHVYHF